MKLKSRAQAIRCNPAANRPPSAFLQSKVHREQPADKALGTLAVTYRAIAELALDPKNPRQHTPRQIGQIARSIETFGFLVPVLVDAKLKVIAGHGRVIAARQLGWNTVPTIRLDHLSEAQARAFMIADNRLTENSTWDDRLLAEQLKELSVLNLDFSLEVTAFDMGEIDLRIEGLSAEEDESAAAADDLSNLPSGPAVTRPGDLWELGEHRVLCASALEDGSYAALMADEQAQMIFSDPPYNVRIGGNVSGLGAIRHREFAMASGEMSETEFKSFLSRAFSLFGRYSVDGSLHYICIDWRHMAELMAAGASVYSELKNVCVWTKSNAGMGSFYRSQHELIFVYRFGRRPHRNNVKLGQYGRNRTNVWTYAGATSFGEEGNLLAIHPTVKPVAMVADAIIDCTSRRALVLDGFLGSGSTVIAAQRTGRRCYGLESIHFTSMRSCVAGRHSRGRMRVMQRRGARSGSWKRRWEKMEPANRAPDYEVGYAKPPRRTQFKKGQSGNPRGRPRGAKNVATVLEQALGERVTISENGRKRSATKMEVILKRLVNKAAQGDYRSTQLLIAYMEKHQPESNRKPTIRDLLELLGPLPDSRPTDPNGCPAKSDTRGA